MTRGGRRPMRRRVAVRGPLATGGAALLIAGVALVSEGVAAASTALKVDRQDSQADTAVNPYTDTDLHVAVDGGTPTQHSYIHIAFGTLPPGTIINALTLSLTQSASATGNVNPQNAAIEACPLTTELPATYDSSHPPQWDCKKAYAVGDADGAGGWRIDVQPLLAVWDTVGNTGAAIVAIPQPLAVGSQLGPAANNWALAFDPAKTTAIADVTPPEPSSQGGATPSNTTPIPQPPPPQVQSGLAPLAAIPPPAAIPPAPPPAVAPAATPAPSNAPAGGIASAAPRPPAAASSITSSTGVSRGWIAVAILLGLIALAAVGAAAIREVGLRGSVSVGAVLGSVVTARSRAATPVSVLILSAVLAVGFAARPAAFISGTGAGASDSGATALNGAGAGASTPGATGPAQPGPPTPGGTAGPGATLPGSSSVAPAGGAPAGAGQPGGSTAAGSSGSPSAAGGPLPRGVTPTTVRVGFFIATNQNTVNQAAGINGLNNTGDARAQAEAIVKWLNARGGIAGHTIDPQFIPEDASNTDPNYQVQLCHQAVDDDQIFAMVDDNSATQDAAQCYISSHTLYFAEGLTQFSADTQRSWGAYYWSPSGPNLDRSMAEELAGLQSKGFFTSQDKIGYMFEDLPSTHTTIDRIVSPKLSQMGYDVSNPNAPNGVVTVGVTPPIADANSLSAINNGVLKMKTSHVTKMFFVDDAGGDLALFSMRDADNLNYHSVTYGLQSQDGLDALAYLEPADQLKNAVGVGYWPWADTSTANSDGFPGSPAEAQCFKIMNGAGIATPNPPGRDGEATVGMIGKCDAMLLLYDGAQGLGQNLSATSFAAGAERLGTSYQDGNGYANSGDVAPGHHDAVDNFRLLHWDPSCTNGYDGGTGKGSSGCFKLDSRTSYRSPEV